MNRNALLPLVAFAAVGITSAAQAQSLVFDNMTGTTFQFTGSTPRNLMGGIMNLGNVTSGPVSLTGMDFAFANFTTAATYSSVRFDVTFFDVANSAATGTTPAFTSPVGSTFFTLSNFSAAANTFYTFQGATPGAVPGVVFGAPITLNNVNNVGVQILVRTDSGTGLVSNPNFTLGIASGAAPAVGTSNLNGYYRNASQANPTDASTSLLGSDSRTLSLQNQGLGVRLFTAGAPVPEPATMAALGLGAAALLRRRRKSA